MDNFLTNFLQGIFTGKLAWVKVTLGLVAGTLVSLDDFSAIVSDKYKPYVVGAVAIGTWLSTHGFHKAEAPQKKLGS